MTTSEDAYSTLLTPAGSGAIALIRVVGTDSWPIVSQVFEPANKAGPPLKASDKLHYGWIVQDGEKIDDVIVSLQQQKSPPFVDISTHAGIRIVERVLAALSEAGAPLLETSFTQAWPANSLIEQEALSAMQQVKSKQGAAFSMQLRKGLQPLLMNLVDRIRTDPNEASESLLQLQDGFRHAHALLHGISIALIGPPNSGKSTLFNRLLGRPAAIVSQQAGTTRDWISGVIEIDGIPVSIIDTAGRRQTKDNLEKIAIEKGYSRATNVDGCMLVIDASMPLGQPLADDYLSPHPSIPTVIAMNKCDLEAHSNTGPLDTISSQAQQIHNLTLPSIRCSAATNEGVDSLLQKMLLAAGIYGIKEDRLSLFTHRQTEAVQRILDMLPKSPNLAASAIIDDLVRPIYQG